MKLQYLRLVDRLCLDWQEMTNMGVTEAEGAILLTTAISKSWLHHQRDSSNCAAGALEQQLFDCDRCPADIAPPAF